MLTYQLRVDFGAEFGGEVGVALYKGKTGDGAASPRTDTEGG